MTTDFFTQIKEHLKGINISLSISQNDDTFAVSIHSTNPSKDNAIRLLNPLNVTGTTDELDEHFFTLITKPLNDTKSLIDNSNSYIEQQEAIKKQTQKAKDLKSKTEKIVTEINKLITDTSTIKSNEKIITKHILELSKLDPDHKKILEAKLAITKFCSQENLFN